MTLTVQAPDGVPEIRAGDDLAALLVPLVELADGDVVLVTSKVVSKAEGRVVAGDRDAALPGETVRVVARRGPTTIVRNRLGLTMAAAGIDASNVATGHVVLLPDDPDASARRIRARLAELAGVNVGVIVTDTAGRAWRVGQTDIAIGAAGVAVTESFAGRADAHGNALAVTEPAVADQLAGAAELAQGKLAARPFAVVSGRPDLVLPAGVDGPGARALVREEGGDLFGYGAREAVLRALAGDPDGLLPFGAPVAYDELAGVLADLLTHTLADRRLGAVVIDEDGLLQAPAEASYDLLRAACFAHGWLLDEVEGNDSAIRLGRLRPGP